MKYHSILIGTLTVFSFLATASADNGVADLRSQRLSRWQERSVARQVVVKTNSDFSLDALARPAGSLYSDLKINSDNLAATFGQRYCDIAHFSDGRGVIVWEDERNGLWRIAAQPINSVGAAVGTNKFLDNSNPPVSLRQPRVAANSLGTVLVIYVNESDNGLYGRKCDFGFSTIGAAFRIDDATPGNLVNQPEITLLSGNRFVTVWEDSRNGSNIFAQILNSDGSKSGNNFQINQALPSPYRIAPAVKSSLVGDFAVVWEDGRSDDGDVYLRIFTDVGTPLFAETQIDAAFASDYQFMPKVDFISGSGYLAGWISNRNGGQSVYAQVISTSSVPIGSSFRVNDAESDVCWDLTMQNSSDSGVVCLWAEYSGTASIELQKISKAAALVGGIVKLEDNGLLRERSFPTIARNSTGFTTSWIDQREGNLDVFAQRLLTGLVKENVNIKINDDVSGSQQLVPDIAGVNTSVQAIIWQDRKDDQGDVTLQFLTSAGTFFGSSTRVNDDVSTTIQKNPRVAAVPSGPIWTVWEDARTGDDLLGQNIFAQRFDGSGNRQGTNFLVNGDATSKPKSNPDLDVSGNGSVIITWTDERDNTRQIYAQGYSSSGSALGTNIRVTALPVGTQNFESHIGVRNDGSYVIAWLAVIGDKQAAFFQRYNSNNLPAGTTQMIEIDSSLVQVLDLDICVHKTTGRFYLATIERENSNTNIKMRAYDSAGNPVSGAAIVSDVPGDFSDIRCTADVSDALAIVWTANGASGQRGHLQIMRSDGFAIGSNQLISPNGASRTEISPAVLLTGGFHYCVWADSRNPGAGFDIYSNSAQYTSTSAEDEADLILPREFALEQNYPNPFNPETIIKYSIERPSRVSLVIFNVLGQAVDQLVNEIQPAGSYELRWNGANKAIASGIYLYRLTVGDQSLTKKMTLLK